MPFQLTVRGTTTFHDDADKDAVMLQYWRAKQAGDPGARIERVQTVAGQVSALALDRIDEQQGWLDEAGFSVPPPIYAPGTRVLPLGDQNFRLERTCVQDMPEFSGAAQAIVDEVAAECRRDRTVHTSAVSMTEDGSLAVSGERLALERGAFLQLASLCAFGMGSRYLSECCGPDLRAHNVNTHLRTNEREITLRTRGADQRTVFASVTPSYAAVDTDVVLEAVSGSLQEAHTEMMYTGSGVKATALWMPDQVVDLAAGDIFKVGVRVETDDTGRGRIRISGVVWRNRCLNLIVIGEGEVETVSVVHRGDPARILELVSEGVEKARATVGNFLEAWGHARSVRVDPVDTIARWVESRRVQVPGVRSEAQRDALVQTLLDSWAKEEGDSLADAVNAVTRAAHENPLWGVNIREELERQASRLVYAAA